MTLEVQITRRATFAAAHVLARPEWDAHRNQEAFGACFRDHGHNYVVEVTVAGPLDPATGMVMNLKNIDRVLKQKFIEAVDHRHLNRDVPFLQDVVPTAENIAVAAWGQLEADLKPARLVRLRLVESENNSAEVIAL